MPRTVRGSGDGKRVPLSFRTTPRIRELLLEAATASGRSLAQEVEYRLESTFSHDRAFGNAELRRLTLAMAIAFERAARFNATNGKDWTEDLDSYFAGMVAVLDTLLINAPATPGDAARMLEKLNLVVEALKSSFLTRLAWAKDKNKEPTAIKESR
jgi:hypothetical protein